MRRQQLIQLLQFIFAWILLWLFVVFVMEKSFVNFMLKYWLYFLIVSVSYFYYYSIQYEPDNKYRLIRNVLIYGNAYFFLHIFFRPQLNISHHLFILLWLIILWVWRTTRLKTRWKYLLQIVWWIFSFFILISGIFYFYPEEPDIKWFLESRSNEVKILWVNNQVEKNDAYIKITSQKSINDFIITPWFTKILSEDVRIAYPSLRANREEKMIVETPQWDLVWIFPQSEVQMEFDWKDLKSVLKFNWRIWFLSWVFKSSLEYSGEKEILTSDQQERFIGVQSWYKNELVLYLKNQISESNIGWANNTVMYNIDWKIIKILAKMFPVSFSDNLHNYSEFQKYFSRLDEWSDLGRYEMKQWSWWSLWWIWCSMKDNIDIWKNNIYGRFKKPEKE